MDITWEKLSRIAAQRRIKPTQHNVYCSHSASTFMIHIHITNPYPQHPSPHPPK